VKELLVKNRTSEVTVAETAGGRVENFSTLLIPTNETRRKRRTKEKKEQEVTETLSTYSSAIVSQTGIAIENGEIDEHDSEIPSP
jgi:hypothetical protein